VIKFLLAIFIGTCLTVLLASFSNSNSGEVSKIEFDSTSLETALLSLGDEKLLHSMPSFDEEKAKLGYELITSGRTLYKGKKSKLISKHFVCTDCHNLTKEFRNVGSESTDDRLSYAINNGLNFLPASTFWGIYNRTSFYNGDYVDKYGEMALDSRDTLENAVQLCAKYCSSGRSLKEWELEAIMHYYKKNELQLSDLNLTKNSKSQLKNNENLNLQEKIDLIKSLKGNYRQSYSATFLGAMPENLRKYGENGNVENGEAIYDRSCLHCHAYKRVTYLSLNKSRLTARMFWRNRKNYSDKSLYQIIRWGTHAKAARKQYMPRFTKEKMSDEQLNDLVAYIKQLAKK